MAGKYEDLWNYDSRQHAYAIEASTGYSKYPLENSVPRRMFDYPLRPKIIYLVRNPFDRIVSHYHHLQNRGVKQTCEDISLPHLIDCSNYYMQLEQYKQYFPSQDILVLEFEDVIKRTSDTIKKIYAFLGLPCDRQFTDFPQINRTEKPTQLEIRMSKNRVGRFAAKLIPDRIKPFTKRVIIRCSQTPPKKILNSEEKQIILQRLSADMKKLHDTYGIDVGEWGF